MQQADVRVGALNHFAVQLQNQAQHTVRRRVLRTKVQRVVTDFSHRSSPRANDARRIFARLDGYRLVDHARLVRS